MTDQTSGLGIRLSKLQEQFSCHFPPCRSKRSLAGEGGRQRRSRLPAHSAGLHPRPTHTDGTGLLSGNIALCNPPDQAMGFFAPFIQSQLQTITATFPNEIALVPGDRERHTERSAPETAVGPLWHLIFPVLPVPAPAGDCGVRGAQPPRPAALVGLAAVDHRSHCRLDRPGWFSFDRLVPSIDHPNLWSSLPAPFACLGHRRDGQCGREPDAGPGDRPGICAGSHWIVDGYCGKFHNKATKIPNPRLLLKDFPKLVFIL